MALDTGQKLALFAVGGLAADAASTRIALWNGFIEANPFLQVFNTNPVLLTVVHVSLITLLYYLYFLSTRVKTPLGALILYSVFVTLGVSSFVAAAMNLSVVL